MNKAIKSIMRISIVLFGIILLIALSSVYTGTPERVRIVKDEYNIKNLDTINKILINEKNYNFSNLKDFNKQYSSNILTSGKCYYLNSILDNKGFILAIKLESNKYIKKYNNDYLIYKSDADYIITDEIMINIKKITSNICND